MGKLYYFQAPNLDINPTSAIAPRLGSIFAKLDTLTAPLNQDEQLTVPERLLNISGSSDFRTTSSRSLQGEIGLNATAASGLAGSADLIYALARDKQETYACHVLETLEFAPDQTFVDDSIIASQRVQRFLEDSLFGRKKVYMITGLKIASGLSRSTLKETQHGPSLKVSASGAALGIPIPVEAGPEVGVTFGSGRTVTDGPALNKTVFAYRVIQIKVKWDGEARYKHRSGGKYADDDDDDEDDSDGDDGQGKWVLEEAERPEFSELVRVESED